MFISSVSFAGNCPQLYRPTIEPLVVSYGTELCNSFYVSIYDSKNMAVRFVSERLRGSLVGSQLRVDSFKIDSRIKNSAKPSEYVNTKFDKGHMAPSDNASTSFEMVETFLMTNMTPQEPTLNRVAWRNLEDSVRELHLKNPTTDTYIETIPTYVSSRFMGRIPIPDGYWKIVTKDGKTVVYYADNKPNAQIGTFSTISVSTLMNSQRL